MCTTIHTTVYKIIFFLCLSPFYTLFITCHNDERKINTKNMSYEFLYKYHDATLVCKSYVHT